MRIISKLKDYYDNGAIYGIDKKIVFVRTINESEDYKKENFPIKKNYFYSLQVIQRNPTEDKMSYRPFIIGFCGTCYVGYEFTLYKKNKTNSEETLTEETIFLYGDEAKEYLLNYLYKKRGHFKAFQESLTSFFNDFDGKKCFAEIYKEYNVPYFLLKNLYMDFSRNHYFNLYTNILLKKYKFHQIKDSVQAFQEISMFIPYLNESEEERELTDKEKIQAHSLDETSFRCQSPGKRKPRGKNKTK